MKKSKLTSIEMNLSHEVYDGWKRYCKYHGLTSEEAIEKIVTGWINHNTMKGEAILAELRGDMDEIEKSE